MANSGGNGPERDDGPLGEAWQQLQRFQREAEERKQAQAADPRFSQDPPTYEEAAAEWALRDWWAVAEAANLLCGCEPLRPTGLPGQTHERLDREVRKVQQALLRSKVTRKGKSTEALMPAQDVMAWARAKGVAVPDALAAQVPSGEEEGSSSSDSQPGEPHGNALRFSNQREAILQAAVAVIARYRHQCLDKGAVSAAAVARQIEVHQGTLFTDGEAPQSSDAMRKLIARALNLWNADQ